MHHGNGTQHAFYEDARVLYVSTHQFPFYPGTGAADEIGQGAGAGLTLNVPLEAGATDADYASAYLSIARVLSVFDPQLLLISAGFDAHADDPLASMRLTTAGYAAVVAQLRAAVRGPIAAVTEGGYDLEALHDCLTASIEILAAPPPGPIAIAVSRGDRIAPRAERALALFRPSQPRWRDII